VEKSKNYAQWLIKRSRNRNTQLVTEAIQKAHEKYVKQINSDLYDVCMEQVGRILEDYLPTESATIQASNVAENIKFHLHDSLSDIHKDMRQQMVNISNTLLTQFSLNVHELEELMNNEKAGPGGYAISK